MEKKQKDHGGVLITIYVAPTKMNKPRQTNGRHRKPKWRKPTSAVGYNRRAELLAYTQRLRRSGQMARTRSKSLNATKRLRREKRNAPNMGERRKWGTKIRGLFCLPRRSRRYQQMADPEKVGIFANLNLYLRPLRCLIKQIRATCTCKGT
ncbi:uncharacterized protein LOC116263245 [Nymphaea colorata]|nr:uncharacterized protein LOC116263245 [Nymphaea colorata]